MYQKPQKRSRQLNCERLETRLALSGLVGSLPVVDADLEQQMFHAVIVAGESPDSPSARVDSNTDNSVFDGVGSLTIATRRGNYICTGTPIDDTHVVTAAHCVDLNNDGKSNTKDGINSITFNLNYGVNYSSKIVASSWVTHPNFTGFNRPSINDDVAVLTLSQAIPQDVPRYSLFTQDLSGRTITLVGYGQSGDGVNGYTVGASYTIKRMGQNVVDAFYAQDDSNQPVASEVFRFDFDRDNGTNGPLGGRSLGNLVETTLGGGDSGGPSFVFDGTNYLLAGVNTFSQSTATASAPKFGSMGGGMSIPAYASWINKVVAGAATSNSDATGNGRNTAGDSVIDAIRFEMDDWVNIAIVIGVEPSVWSTTVQNVDLAVGRKQEMATFDQFAAAPSATVVAIDRDSIGNDSSIRRFRSSNQELDLDDVSELERLAAVDAYHAFFSDLKN